MSLLRGFLRFLSHKRGNVTLITAFAVIPVASAIGAGVDFSNAMSARYRLQDAADSAAIAGAQEATGVLANQQSAADKAFKCNIAKPASSGAALDCNTIDPRLASATGALSMSTVSNVTTATYTAQAKVNTFVLGIIGIDSLTINATANAGVSINSAEIAFVLDNTGSMSSNNKMTYLKSSLDATLASLLDSNGSNAGKTKVALVPFDTQVALSNVSGMTSYTGNFVSVSQGYTCTNLTTAQCGSVTTNNNYLTNWISSNYSSSAGTTATNNTVTYTRSSGSYYYVYSAAYFSNPNYNPGCYRYCNSGYQYPYITYYYVATYNSSGVAVGGYGSSSMQGYYISSAGSYSPSQVGYSGYTLYNGLITYGYPTAGGYNSGSTTVYMDNNTINSTDSLLGVGTSNWSGCVIDRTQPYDVQADAPVSSNSATLYPASKCATNSLLPIMDLTTDIAAARTYAQKMTPAGNTNITIGIQWGMEILSPTAPFSNGAQFSDKSVNKYMIVLTDGLNTQNRWTTTSSTIDARTALACTNAKALGITVFTVRLEQGNSAMLQACASKSDYYYNLSNANQISGALGSIMKSIKKIRLTK